MLEIKVLETEEFEADGGVCLRVPIRVEINGHEYKAVEFEFDEPLVFSNVYGLALQELEDLKIGDIPLLLILNCENTDIGWLKLSQDDAVLKIDKRHPKNWKRRISVDNYFKILGKLACNHNFYVFENVDENRQTFNLEKFFPSDTTIGTVYEVFKRVLDEVWIFGEGVGMGKFKVLDTEEVKFHDEVCIVPSVIEINGHEYLVERKTPLPLGNVYGLTVDELKDWRLKDAPKFAILNCDDAYGTRLRIEECYVSLERWQRINYRYSPDKSSLEESLKLLRSLIEKNGFQVIRDEIDSCSVAGGSCHVMEFGKEFQEGTTVGEVYKVFRRLVKKIERLEENLNAIMMRSHKRQKGEKEI